ncbi:uncharacterized protein LOC128893859 [Hylaeus anthracinus]|uniref:uncharacterized protein LOC128893859 n=1 Tax=Hylaeus anthracinus TaxID=313031 RepID=UPI0023B95CFD|nr:uncharacterized protein LOC128893859 [Hylaeus anthracinus]
MEIVNPIVTCPYEETHRIRKSKLPYHLKACGEKNHSTKSHCPFDTTHIIDTVNYEAHVANCASSGNIQNYLFGFDPPQSLGTVPLETVSCLSAPVMKHWNEKYVETYDPWKNTENKKVIRYIIGSRSEKRQFRLAERKRRQALDKGDIGSPSLIKSLKHKLPMDYVDISQLINSMRRLYLEDFDILLKSIDISKLFISEKSRSLNKENCMSEVIEKALVQQFQKLMVLCLNKIH